MTRNTETPQTGASWTNVTPKAEPTDGAPDNKDLIRELKRHAQEWSDWIVGDRLAEAADALATSDARIATARSDALEEAEKRIRRAWVNGSHNSFSVIIRALKAEVG